MSAQSANDPINSHVWQVSENFAIHLSLKVATQLTALISLAESTTQTGEICGLLLGRSIDTPSRATLIEDFVLIPAGKDTAPFDAKRAPVVGFFRAERDGALNINTRDFSTFGGHFCESGNVALLIRTPKRGASKAALFYWQNGAAYPCDLGFALPQEAAPLASARAGASSASRIRWARLLPTAALVIVATGALQLASKSSSTVAAAPPATEATPSAATGLGLSVSSLPHRLEIRWHPESPAIVEAETGVMKITEAGTTQTVPFDQSQLRDGYIAYTPGTNDVSIAFEVTGKDGGTTTESVQSVAIP